MNASPTAKERDKDSESEQPGRVLVVEDEMTIRAELADELREMGYVVDTAADGFKALPKLDDFRPDVILTDLKMPGMDGIALMRKAHEGDPERAVIVLTAHAAVESAVKALKQGAYDYLIKPLNVEELENVIRRALERRRLRRETDHLRERLAQRDSIKNIVGNSAVMRKVYDTILQVAPSRASVLITGESGTGKELIAAAIHQHSPRRGGPFVKLHCAALADTLLESELFGHEKGAFTGAVARREGRLEQADTGTLFLDEIGEISPATQVKLLRFLQERELERVGGNQTIKVDVRIVTATHRDLRQRVKDGLFREDLYYRLNVVTIEVPPLRDREADIPLLAMHFLHRYASENGKQIKAFDYEVLQRLLKHKWPGNVRELENAIERAVVVCRGEQIQPSDLSPGIGEEAGAGPGIPRVPGASLSQVERYVIEKTLEHTGGSTSKAADILGISARKIQYKLHEYESAVPIPAARQPPEE